MKKTILFLSALWAISSAAAPAVVNYETIYTQWSEAVTASEKFKVQIEEANARLAVKIEMRDALWNQLNELTSKAKTEADLKAAHTKLDATKKSAEELNKEIMALQASTELRKQIADKQATLRVKVAGAVRLEATEAKVDLVFDVTAQNGFGIPVVSAIGQPVDLTSAVLKRLETSSTIPATATPVSPSK